MDCAEFRDWLHPWVDGELDLPRSLELEGHIQACASCLAAYTELRALRGQLATMAPHPAPARLRDKLERAYGPRSKQDVPAPMPKPPAAQAPSRRLWRPRLAPRWRMGAAGALAGLALGLSVTWMLPRARSSAPEGDLLACHLRSLQANHLEDVASTDRHTVKPWFNGKLDFAPVVVDLADSGFPLAGGRLDYVGGHPAAALVYRRRLHVLNVFQWPAAAGGDGGDSRELWSRRQGYTVGAWRQAGMEWGVVSDLNETELREFVRELRGRVQ